MEDRTPKEMMEMMHPAVMIMPGAKNHLRCRAAAI
jgi:hypothetical protein